MSDLSAFRDHARERSMWTALADEIDAYLIEAEGDVGLFGEVGL